MTVMRPVDNIAQVEGLDSVARPLAAMVRRAPVKVRDWLHGTWLGHPVHPALAYVPVGTWISAALLDGIAAVTPSGPARDGLERSAQTLVGIGLAGTAPAAAAGAADWSDLHEEQQRIGLVHAGANGAAMVLLGASYVLRRSGRHGWGRVFGLAGTSVAGLSASIGGHLSFHWAAGVNHADSIPHIGPGDWTYVARIEELPDGVLDRRVVGDIPVVVLRRGQEVTILADECSHLSGPLSQGDLVEKNGDDCVVCPWHGSTFRFSDGEVVTGPAIAPQPRFDVRIEGGAVTAKVRTHKGVPAS